jgi:hypothetical protein
VIADLATLVDAIYGQPIPPVEPILHQLPGATTESVSPTSHFRLFRGSRFNRLPFHDKSIPPPEESRTTRVTVDFPFATTPDFQVAHRFAERFGSNGAVLPFFIHYSGETVDVSRDGPDGGDKPVQDAVPTGQPVYALWLPEEFYPAGKEVLPLLLLPPLTTFGVQHGPGTLRAPTWRVTHEASSFLERDMVWVTGQADRDEVLCHTFQYIPEVVAAALRAAEKNYGTTADELPWVRQARSGELVRLMRERRPALISPIQIDPLSPLFAPPPRRNLIEAAPQRIIAPPPRRNLIGAAPQRIIASGAPGAEEGALEVAEELNIERGGWITHRITHRNTAARHRLSAAATSDPTGVTRRHINIADAVVYIGRDRHPRSREVAGVCDSKPLLQLDFAQEELAEAVAELRAFLERNRPRVLYVTGGRIESLKGQVKELLFRVLVSDDDERHAPHSE